MSTGYVEGVLDLTFYNISDENSLNTELQNKITFLTTALSPTKRTGLHATFSSDIPEPNFESTSPGSPTATGSPKSRFRKKNIKAIRLGNNEITTTGILSSTLPAHFDTTKILWLDLSFNFIAEIANDFAALFPNITTIYLQSNRLAKLKEVKKLSECNELRSLAMYGNPIEENKHYRNYVIYYCKKLHQFDKAPITTAQKEKVRKDFLFFPEN